MKVEYSKRAVGDLHKIAADSRRGFGDHVAPLVRYPFKIFYRVLDDGVRILHIRHTARRPWQG